MNIVNQKCFYAFVKKYNKVFYSLKVQVKETKLANTNYLSNIISLNKK